MWCSTSKRGAEYLNVRPDDEVAGLRERGRTPLTVDEGIAFVLQFPGSLEKNHCFSLAASRCGDRRVPALWMSRDPVTPRSFTTPRHPGRVICPDPWDS